ncbi:MAG TPA: hypothetical protein DEF88_00585 [Porphyromonadaceae bacterium]|nr:hypothetical protein [Porphyromonadaceae bacterium]HCM21113.1 hypothetical protein [Porphyromonadaceae bacterium]
MLLNYAEALFRSEDNPTAQAILEEIKSHFGVITGR